MNEYREYFTLVFKGDIGQFDQNPMITDTPFGRPVASARGDILEDVDALRWIIELAEPTDAMIEAYNGRSRSSIHGKTHLQAAAINAWRAFMRSRP